MKLPVYNIKGEEKGTETLNQSVFGIKTNKPLLYQTIISFLGNQRRAHAHTKNRGEVSGGGRKPWRQKGTGRARAGSTRSPLWIGGGVTFGPRKERNYYRAVPIKMKRKALFMSLSAKATEKKIILVDKLDLADSKTKTALKILNKLPIEEGKILFVTAEKDKNFFMSVKNLPFARALDYTQINAYEVLNHDYIVLEAEALEKITNHFKKLEIDANKPEFSTLRQPRNRSKDKNLQSKPRMAGKK